MQATGKAINSLPESERLVRQFHAAEVLKTPLVKLDSERPRPAGTSYVPPTDVVPQPAAKIVPVVAATAITRTTAENQPSKSTSAAPRFFLNADDDIVDAPSIGPKTATRFQEIEMHKVRDVLNADAEATAKILNTRHITAAVIRDWQDQSHLMIDVPGLRGHDAQILVAAEIRNRTSLSQSTVAELLKQVVKVAGTTEGKRILRSGAVPDEAEVTEWITAAQLTSNQKAAQDQARSLP